MTHVEKVIMDVITALRKIREEQEMPMHGIIWGNWGTGKTVASKKISSATKDVFYLKVPDGELTKGRLFRLIGYSLGCGARHSYEGTLDLIKHHIIYYNLRPIFVLDESQRLLKKQHLMNELKDLSEDEDLGFSYIFVGDQTVPKIIASNPSSLHKRLVIKKELQPITEDTVKVLINQLGIQVEPKAIYSYAKSRGWTTIDVAVILQASRKFKEINEGILESLSKALGR
jgi:type II secretory pathway predicted ATPase ExeA